MGERRFSQSSDETEGQSDNIDRLSHRLDYIAYSTGISGAYVICDLSLASVLIIFVLPEMTGGLAVCCFLP